MSAATSTVPLNVSKILDGLSLLRAYDSDFSLFGASSHEYRLGPRLSEAEVSECVAAFDPVAGRLSTVPYGCALRFVLVVNGPAYGQVWFDAAADMETARAIAARLR